MFYWVKFRIGVDKERILRTAASSLEEAKAWSERQVKQLNKTTKMNVAVESITETSNADPDSTQAA
jgi:hypothetical protein